MHPVLKAVLVVVLVVQGLVGIGFALRLEVVTAAWPFPVISPTSYTFVGSIFVAAAASTLWCVLTDEDAALGGIALDYIAIGLPAMVLAWSAGIPGMVAIFAATAVVGIGVFAWAVRRPFRDARRTPLVVRLAFGFFVVALLLVGSQLALGRDILPWATNTETAMLYGWFFLGAAAYFAYGVIRPVWGNAGGQLSGFLAYDLVLLVPFLLLLPTIPEPRLPSLVIYLVVIVLSMVLALVYLPLMALRGRRAAAGVATSPGGSPS